MNAAGTTTVTRLNRYRQWWRGQPKSLAQLCQQIDAEYHIPRPAAAQHLPAYQAALNLLGDCGQAVLLIASGFLSAWLFLQASHWLALRIEIEIAAHCLGIIAVLISWIEAAQLWLPYYQYEQRVTYGSARWADARVLRDLKLALKKDEPLPLFTLLLGGLGWKHNVVLGPEHSTCHLAMFGPPRSGKSSTFFITWQRAWAGTGSVIVLDPNGELYDQTAYLFDNVYRIDLQTPERSDRWNFLPDCSGNAEFAHKVASMILDSEQSRRSTADPFWKEAEKAALTAILLQLNQLHPRPAPHMIQELISTLSLQQLNELMMKSSDPKVPLYWGMFSKVEPKLQAGVLIGLGVACADFSTPNMMAIASPITNPMAVRGVRFVNFSELRQTGTAIFMIVPEGDAERYKRILSTFFGLANDCLRNGVITEESAPVLFNLDEIGNIHIPDLPAALGVGRGRRMTYALGYQNIAQLYHQYGTDGGDAVLGSVGAMVFLPGVDQRTAEYASKRLGTTTVLQASSVDVHDGNKLDQERSTEVGRALMDAGEIRQMTKYKQAVAIISNAPPVRLTFPKLAKADHPPLSAREKQFQLGKKQKVPLAVIKGENKQADNSLTVFIPDMVNQPIAGRPSHTGYGKSPIVGRPSGFDDFYGFTRGYAVDSFDERMMIRLSAQKLEGKPQRRYKQGEYLATDAITDHALDFVADMRKARQPYFLYVAFQAPHFPVQSRAEDAGPCTKTFDKGWDKLRAERLARMKKVGSVAKNTPLTPRSKIHLPDVAKRLGSMTEDGNNPPWDALPADRRADLAGRMKAFAGMVAGMDRNIGRLIADLKQSGELDNTLILFLSDDGACAEWEPFGFDMQPMAKIVAGTGIGGGTPGLPNKLRRGADVQAMGGADSLFSYGSAWAGLSNTPWRLYKHYSHEGGISSPLIVHLPAQIKTRGQWRNQAGHIVDILATLVDIAGATYPRERAGVTTQPMAGVSLRPAFANQPLLRKAPLFFEHDGSRAIRDGDWKLVAMRGGEWELYNIASDRTEMNNLSAQHPDKVKALAARWDEWANRTHVLPRPGGK